MGKKENVAAGNPRHSLRRRQDPQFRGRGYTDPPLLWLFSSPTADSWLESSQFGLFLCVERIPWDALEAEVEDEAGDLLEHLVQRFIQREETLLACKPTSVITADHCWEMNPCFCIVLPRFPDLLEAR